MAEPAKEQQSSPEAKSTQDLIGRTFDGRYRIDKLLGRGGMGAVYRAQQLSMDKPIALKVLAKHLAEEERQVQRFNQEALTSSRLKHPNTIRVLDYGKSEDGFLYLAMELLEGYELSRVIRSDGALKPPRALKIARQMTKSIGEAHQIGLVHRDLKPDNIFLCDFFGEKDFVKVLDFGIAKFMEDIPGQESLTQTGFICGTPLYIAPEQALGRPVTPRTDLYSLGVILYEMLTGQPPFRADTPIAIVMRHIHDTPPPMSEIKPDLEIPPELEQLVMTLLQKDPRHRPSTAEEVGLLLEDILASGLLGPQRRPSTVSNLGALPEGAVGGPPPTPAAEAAAMAATAYLPEAASGVNPNNATLALDPGEALAVASGQRAVGSSSSQLQPGAMVHSPTQTGTINVGNDGAAGASAGKGRGLVWALAAAAVVALGVGGAWAAGLFSGPKAPQAPAVARDDAQASAKQPGVQPPAGDDKTALIEPTQGEVPGTTQAGVAADPANGEVAVLDIKDPDPVVEAKATAALEVTIDTVPSKAEVFDGATMLGNTPLKLTLDESAAQRKLTLKLSGHKERELVVDRSALQATGQSALTVTLEAEAAEPEKPEKKVTRPTNPGGKKDKKPDGPKWEDF